MPKKEDDAPVEAGCHGCARVDALDDDGYCDACARVREADPPITIHGRTLLFSELKAQAEDGDKDLVAALEGDTVQEQLRAAKKR